jgi:hypothetical protein
MAIELATQYLPYVDEMFTRESKKDLVTNQDFDWTGAKSVKIYKITTAEMNDYDRGGVGMNQSRYGEIKNLEATTQQMQLNRDRSFTFAIDTLDMDETKRQLSGASALARQIREVIIPEVDSWTYNKMCSNAGIKLKLAATDIKETTIYDLITDANEKLDETLVPETNRFIVVPPSVYALLKRSKQTIMETDIGQEMRLKGVVGYIDGLAVIKVPSIRLPQYAKFLVGHPSATVAPVKLESYKSHDDPPGISGILVEGRINYDTFVLDNKANGLIFGYSVPNGETDPYEPD